MWLKPSSSATPPEACRAATSRARGRKATRASSVEKPPAAMRSASQAVNIPECVASDSVTGRTATTERLSETLSRDSLTSPASWNSIGTQLGCGARGKVFHAPGHERSQNLSQVIYDGMEMRETLISSDARESSRADRTIVQEARQWMANGDERIDFRLRVSLR